MSLCVYIITIHSTSIVQSPWFSSKRCPPKRMYIFTLYRTSVIILTPPPLPWSTHIPSPTHPHIQWSNCAEKVLCKPREKCSLKSCVFRFLLKVERDGELRTIVRREFWILTAWKWKDLFPADLRLASGIFKNHSLLHQKVKEGW